MDKDDNLGIIGTVPNVQADNKWHHAEFDLYGCDVTITDSCTGELDILDVGLLIAGAVLSFWPLMLPANLAGAAIVALVIWRTRRRGQAVPA